MVTSVHLHVPDHGRSYAFAEAMIETNGSAHSILAHALTLGLYLDAATGTQATGASHQARAGR